MEKELQKYKDKLQKCKEELSISINIELFKDDPDLFLQLVTKLITSPTTLSPALAKVPDVLKEKITQEDFLKFIKNIGELTKKSDFSNWDANRQTQEIDKITPESIKKVLNYSI